MSAVSAAGGVVAALTAGFASFMTVAGGVAAGLGLITGNKGLQKLGGILSLTGGIANAATSLAGGAGGAAGAGEASSAWDAAGSAAGSDAAQFGKYAQATESIAPEVAQAGSLEAGKLGYDVGRGLNLTEPVADGVYARAQPPSGLTGDAAQLGRTQIAPLTDAPSKTGLLEIAKTMKASDLASLTQPDKGLLQQLWDDTGSVLGKAGQFARDNKELVNLGAGALQGMYGPEAELMDYRKSVMERARRNLNNPIRLQYTTPPTRP